MNYPIQILSAALLLQIILAVSLFTVGEDSGAFVSNEKLLGLDLKSIEKITIKGDQDKTVLMEKQGDLWKLPDYYNFPVSSDKLQRVADKLFSLTKSWPVATTADAAKRFKVSVKDFERKIIFAKGGRDLKTLLIGTSPGFKKVHARLSDQDDIYSIAFSAFEANSNVDDWVQKDFLKFDQSEIMRAELPSLVVVKKDDGLAVADLIDSEESVTDEVNELFRKLANLSFSSILGTENKSEYKMDSPVFKYTLSLKDKRSVDYVFGELGEDSLVLKVSSHPYFFKINTVTLETIQDIKRDKLVQLKAPIENQGSDEQLEPVKGGDADLP